MRRNAEGRVFCDCPARCIGGKWIAERTYRDHKKIRRQQIQQQFIDILGPYFASINATDHASKRRRVAEPVESTRAGPSNAARSSASAIGSSSHEQHSHDGRSPDGGDPNGDPPNFPDANLQVPPASHGEDDESAHIDVEPEEEDQDDEEGAQEIQPEGNQDGEEGEEEGEWRRDR
ncbi:hypothetical protein NEOLEDRAFT_87714 [Neolentinus lepideus HHB14362 ss-1]|uniref:Uncharacterized protein n=1 Tax=Neolentinus lepideus HHB14362 ss-1 TaxID=1314782 RepID=A0A165MX17_9AGAM|nr:hypothetical protein NEOLEDRAFT_87714 [Neolentinus lepideus HHB14362 ss-1]